MRRSVLSLSLVFLVFVVLAVPMPAGGVAGFGDVAEGQYFTEPVQWMVDNEITTGTSATCFSPGATVTRGEVAAFLWRMEGSPKGSPGHQFTDVVAPWQQDPVSWMAAQAITTGTTATTFSPEASVTRGQVAAFLHRLAGSPPAPPATQFTDVTEEWQIVPVGWMVQNGITTGTTPATFSPDDIVTRGQIAAFLYRYKGSPTVAVDSTHPTSPACEAQVPGPQPITLVIRQYVGSTLGSDAASAGQFLAAALSDATGKPFDVAVAVSGRTAYELMCSTSGTTMGLVSTLTYSLASVDCGVAAGLRAIRFGSDSSRTQFVVPIGSTASNLTDLQGLTWAYSTLTSSTGYIVPSGMLAMEGITAVDSPQGTHVAALDAVANGSAGFATTFVSPPLPAGVKVILQSPPVPNDPVAFGASFDPLLRQEIETALLALASEPAWNEFGDLYTWDGLVRATDAEWNWLRSVLSAAGFGIEDL